MLADGYPLRIADEPTLVVDGFAVATWRLADGRVEVRPFAPIDPRHDAEIAAEGERLARFLGYSGWRMTGRLAAPASSSRRTGVVYGALRAISGSSAPSRRISAIASANASSVSRVSVSVGSISSASSTSSGK